MPRSAMCRGATALFSKAVGLTTVGLLLLSCAHIRPCDGIACAPACPRDSALNDAGRCACTEGGVSLLGACVPPAVADAFCGPAAVVDSRRDGSGGCVFRSCGASDVLDLASGACVPRGSFPRAESSECTGPSMRVVEDGRAVCVAREATCPRGTTRRAGATACSRPPACPPGSLPDGESCRAIITATGNEGVRSGYPSASRVDVGAWATLAIGVDGGPGSPALCQPLAQRPNVVAAAGVGPQTLRIALALLLPDEDISRLHAEFQARDASGHDASPAVQALVSGTVETILELLRSLGGEASTAVVELEVSCSLGI